MQRSNFGRAFAGLLGLALLVASGQAAMAMPKESGDYDCSCKGGSGSCTFKSGSTSVSCYKGAGNSCSGKCELSTTPDSGSATKGSVKSGPITSGGVLAH
jgi:hypothetical protein